jgi:hypothetical protein
VSRETYYRETCVVILGVAACAVELVAILKGYDHFALSATLSILTACVGYLIGRGRRRQVCQEEVIRPSL